MDGRDWSSSTILISRAARMRPSCKKAPAVAGAFCRVTQPYRPSQAVLLARLLHGRRPDLAAPGELGERRDDDRLGVDAEVAAGGVPGVRQAEAVGAQRRVVLLDPLRDLVG